MVWITLNGSDGDSLKGQPGKTDSQKCKTRWLAPIVGGYVQTWTNFDQEKEWKGIKLISSKEEEDGTNNYSEFKQKVILELDAASYWQYVDGLEYNHSGAQTKCYVIRDGKSVDKAWIALKNEDEPANALTAVTIRQQIIVFQCTTILLLVPSHGSAHQKLRDADPSMIPDSEFTKHLVLLMTQHDAWRYCCNWLRDRGKVKAWTTHFRAPMRLSHPVRTITKVTKHLLPYNGQQHSAPCKFCENIYCKTPVSHTKADCFSYTGGKAGKYPENFCSRRDVHLSHKAQTAAQDKQALEGRGSDAGN
ncbi:hypothetical protein C8R43DRAFT_951564 [Mycena crocata]|nr:hypothetical protein C8R43DRAFT_951564 [Mycena crocata]